MTKRLLRMLTMLLFVAFHGIPLCVAQTQRVESGASSGELPKLVFAHYMHCFVCGYMAKEQLFDEAGANDLEHFPRVEKSYRQWWSTDMANQCVQGKDSALEIDFDMGERAGLDAFGVLFHRGLWPGSQFAAGLEAMFRVAQKRKVKVFPEIWEDSPRAISDAQNSAQLAKFGIDLKKLMDQYPNGVLRISNKPVMLLATLDKENCQTLAPLFKPWGGPNGLFLIAYVHPNPYKKGDYLKSPSALLESQTDACPIQAVSQWTAANDYGDPTSSALPRVASAGHAALVWPVNLPFYNVRPDFSDPGPEWVAESLGAERFVDQWRDAILNKAKMVDLQTWNDFSETALTDTNHHGVSYIDLNRHFADDFHGKATEVGNDRLWMFYHHQLVGARTGGRHSDDPGNRNTTPLTDFVEAISDLKQPGNLSIDLGAGAHYSLDAPAGFHDWLIIAGSSRLTALARAGTKSSAEAFERPGSFPTSSATRTVQRVPSLSPGLPVLSLKRLGKAVLVLKGRTPIQPAAPLEDLDIVGSETASH